MRKIKTVFYENRYGWRKLVFPLGNKTTKIRSKSGSVKIRKKVQGFKIQESKSRGSFFFIFKGLRAKNVVPPGSTVNAEFYKNVWNRLPVKGSHARYARFVQSLVYFFYTINVILWDEAAVDLFETLKDDSFVKAIDMHDYGLTNRSALSALNVNDPLAVLDVRNNAQISAVMLTAVMARLYENGANSPDVGLWKWTRLNRDVTWDPSSSATFV